MGLQENWEINALLGMQWYFYSITPHFTIPIELHHCCPAAILCVKNVVDQQMSFLLNTAWTLKGSLKTVGLD